ncbi:hypothetical protein Scep_001057 [Stephania cephalantha]|uniref:Pentatricopeptide repeat-containing protein n=1 Tax=Stephania cephalantha TaxID=152367 RepID=A0AAP0Q7C4_9MAGN
MSSILPIPTISSSATASPPPPPPTTITTTLTADRAAHLIDKTGTLHHLLEIHAALLRHGLHQNPILNFKLQRSYASLGHLDHSTSLFRRTHNPNVFFWTSIIHAHALHAAHHPHALSLYAQMLSNADAVRPNAFTLSSVLKSCPIEPGRALHGHALKMGFICDVYVGTAVLDVYARAGDVVAARKVFDEMPERSLVCLTAMITCYAKNGGVDEARAVFDGVGERDVVCWNVMIDGYVQRGRPGEALGMFRRMLAAKVRPTEVTFLAVLSACAQIGALECGRWVHSYIENNGVRLLSVHVGTALVDMYCKCGSLEDARMVFDGIKGKDVVAWNSMIVGYAMHGFSKDAMELFARMRKLGVWPTNITFIGVLSACSHAGLVTEGRSFFKSMKDEYQIEPKIEHYGCMVDLLGRAGLLDEAYELVKNMEMDPDLVLWGTLLAACRLHGRYEMGEQIAEWLVCSGLANSGTCTLLSNIYAATGNGMVWRK